MLSQKLRLSADEIQVERPWMTDPMIVNREVLSAALVESQSGQMETLVSIPIRRNIIRNYQLHFVRFLETPLLHDEYQLPSVFPPSSKDGSSPQLLQHPSVAMAPWGMGSLGDLLVAHHGGAGAAHWPRLHLWPRPAVQRQGALSDDPWRCRRVNRCGHLNAG